MIRNQKFLKVIRLTLTYIFLLIMVCVTVYPILWLIGASFNTGDSLYSSTMFPKNPTLDHYRELMNNPDYPFYRWYWNTIKVAAMTAILGLVLCSLTAYAYSRFRFPGRKYGLMTMLVIQMFPSFMNMVALYVLLNMAGLLDSHLGLVLVYAGTSIPFNTWILKGYFDTIPKSLEEAALIDGASRSTIFWRIMIPLSAPVLAVITIFHFVIPFGDFILARLLLTSVNKYTLTVGLFTLISNNFGKNWTTFTAGALLMAIPIVILYLSLQKYFISGLTKGATKG
ncbi:sugar ABC transporter permease [Anoxybacter fermentans]|uniref:Sugar ABC transporter permease n=1 Tax=Anoxybacter fermentans TaxID=1323375 RepID=A0A3Q9HP08_9FIRM|nr:sugar ABC transporter permease [Anoxybacter fermentans]AZR72217.1 sugar ABC transporter permease [Anoxybacter fermentans]